MYEEIEAVEMSALQVPEDDVDSWYIERYNNVYRDPKSFKDWKIVGGLLYYYRPDPTLAALTDEDHWKLVVPKSQRKIVLEQCHSSPEAGHLGCKKSYAKAAQSFFWLGMHRDVCKYVKNCYICQQCKPLQTAPAGLMGKRIITCPWSSVAADCMGPYVRSKKGFTFILIFEDLFTKWVEVIQLGRKDGQSIASAFLKNVIYRHGTPDQLVTDNGCEFVNKVMSDLTLKHEIEHR